MQGMVTGFKLYVKNIVFVNYIIDTKVEAMVYNYNDRLFLGFDVCLYLKEHLYTTIQYYRLVNL